MEPFAVRRRMLGDLVAGPAAGLVRIERADDDRGPVGRGRRAVDEPLPIVAGPPQS